MPKTEAGTVRNRIFINDEWLFSHSFSDEMCRKDYDEKDMESVRLPHTNRELDYNYCNEKDYQELCCYRRHIQVDKNWSDKNVFVTFEGAGHLAVVYVNGEKVAEHRCGYTSFTVELTDFISDSKELIITVMLDTRENLNIPPFGKVIDYMTYGGLYREVYLEITDKAYIKDMYAANNKCQGSNVLLDILADVEIPGSLKENMKAVFNITPADTEFMKKAGSVKTPILKESEIDISEISDIRPYSLKIKDACLWTPDKPYLYDVSMKLVGGAKVYDEYVVRTGFRQTEFKADGFYINGEKFKIRGMDHHQCFPYVGYAMPKSMQVFDADIMKNELSLNAVRTSHYPQSHYFIDRCDEIGLLVFTEFPGWQHIGDSEWKDQAVCNVAEMITEYRNHPSIILWGVRINESVDDDEFYKRTNKEAKHHDPYRQTGGVRNFSKSNLFEDVYTYNDFVHTGGNQGVDDKKKITSDPSKGYLVSEYMGHMFPTKAFDSESHRLEHALRHMNVINDVAGKDDIAGSFGWCMFDYNTHKDFGSGDRICYHGIMDTFRNPKMAAAVYESQKDMDSEDDAVLEISSSMDIGEYPGGNLNELYAFTNADSVKLYKNDEFIAEFKASDSKYKNIPHGAILIDDFIGDQLITKEHFDEKKAGLIKQLLKDIVKYGMASLPASSKLLAARLMGFYGMTYEQGVDLFGKYVANWGGFALEYKFEAIKDGKVVKTVKKGAAEELHLDVKTDHTDLCEDSSYDVAALRICMRDQNDNLASYYQEPLEISVSGEAEIIGPHIVSFKGGMTGTYIKTLDKSGKATVKLKSGRIEKLVEFTVSK